MKSGCACFSDHFNAEEATQIKQQHMQAVQVDDAGHMDFVCNHLMSRIQREWWAFFLHKIKNV